MADEPLVPAAALRAAEARFQRAAFDYAFVDLADELAHRLTRARSRSRAAVRTIVDDAVQRRLARLAELALDDDRPDHEPPPPSTSA